LRRRPLRSGADRAETGLFSRVSSRRRFKGQMKTRSDETRFSHMKSCVHTSQNFQNTNLIFFYFAYFLNFMLKYMI